jgi:hypothetical protein
VNYATVIQRLDTPVFKNKRIYPVLIPNWDNSPRRGPGATIYVNSTPKLFKEHVRKTLAHLSEKEDEDKVLFLKSWNEWAEGNYMEPDLKWGKGYINALREALEFAPPHNDEIVYLDFLVIVCLNQKIKNCPSLLSTYIGKSK